MPRTSRPPTIEPVPAEPSRILIGTPHPLIREILTMVTLSGAKGR
jgi:hypothetical protein